MEYPNEIEIRGIRRTDKWTTVFDIMDRAGRPLCVTPDGNLVNKWCRQPGAPLRYNFRIVSVKK